MSVKSSVYHKRVPTSTVDVYRVLRAFEVTDPCVGHAVKKLLVTGKRLGGKTARQDIEEAIWSLQRKLEMDDEDAKASAQADAAERVAPHRGDCVCVLCEDKRRSNHDPRRCDRCHHAAHVGRCQHDCSCVMSQAEYERSAG